MKAIFVITIAIICIFFNACDYNKDSTPRLPHDWGTHPPTSILLAIRTTSYKAQQIEFEIDVASLPECWRNSPDSFLNYEVLDCQIGSPNFYILSPPEIISIEYIEGIKTEPFTTAILIDQSIGWKTFDSLNFRFSYFYYFLEKMKSEDSVIFGAFARNGLLDHNILTLLSDSFTSGINDDLLKKILGLCFKTGGTCCLYDALYQMIEYMDQHASGNNKSITVVATNLDDGKGEKSLDDVIAFAKSKSIKINTMWFDNEYTTDYLNYSKFCKTGGFMCNGFFRGMMSLNTILRNDLYFNRLKVNLRHWDKNPPYPFPAWVGAKNPNLIGLFEGGGISFGIWKP